MLLLEAAKKEPPDLSLFESRLKILNPDVRLMLNRCIKEPKIGAEFFQSRACNHTQQGRQIRELVKWISQNVQDPFSFSKVIRLLDEHEDDDLQIVMGNNSLLKMIKHILE